MKANVAMSERCSIYDGTSQQSPGVRSFHPVFQSAPRPITSVKLADPCEHSGTKKKLRGSVLFKRVNPEKLKFEFFFSSIKEQI